MIRMQRKPRMRLRALRDPRERLAKPRHLTLIRPMNRPTSQAVYRLGMKRLKRLIVLSVVAVGFASAAQEEKSADETVRYSKTTTINFEDDTIEGDLTRPDGEYVEARKRVKHSNLIRIREEFKDKVMQSVGEL